MDIKTVYAHALAAAAQVVGFAVAFIPNLAAQQQALVGAGGVVLSAAILLAHAVRTRPAGQSAPVAVEALVKAEVGKVNFDGLVAQALSGGVGPLVKGELAKILSGGLAPAPEPAAAVVPPVT